MIRKNKTIITELKSQIFEQFSISLSIKREDENHPFVSGNKWWKLKYNLEQALHEGASTLLTFGGAYSNHIFATAAAARELGLKSIGVIRGERTLPLNSTLTFAEVCGMKLLYVSRELYQDKMDLKFINQLKDQFGSFYLIPEGGTNRLAIEGTKEFGEELNKETNFDYVCLPVGTGGTMAGIMEGLDESKKIIGFPVLKGAHFLEDEIKKYTSAKNGTLIYDYHFGGYAKTTAELNEFIKQFQQEFKIPLDPVYTSKMMFGILDLIRKNYFKRGSKIIAIHTGGLQGRTNLTE